MKNRKGLIGVEGEKRYLLPLERRKDRVCKETDAVSGTKPKIVHKNQNPKPPHLLRPQCHEFEAVEEKKYPRQK